MSRNLGCTFCKFCREMVQLEEQPRPIKPEEAGCYYAMHNGYGYAGGIFANASCPACGAKYLAWVDLSACAGYRAGWGSRQDQAFFDLSFRSSFDDEPGEDDLPDWKLEPMDLTAEQCRKLECFSGTIVRRSPWPRCETTGRKIYYCYGCRCAHHRP